MLASLSNWANPPEGSMAVETAEGLGYHYHSGKWIPESIWIKTETDILANADRLDGQMAVAEDTGHVYVWNNGRWMSSQVQHYATEQALLNDAPSDGVLAWGDDTGLVYARTGGSWKRVNSPTVVVGSTVPPAPGAGDIHLDDSTGATTIYDGNTWVNITGTPPPVGEIIMYPKYQAPPGFMLCDGRSVDPNVFPKLYAIVGANVPDLRSQFIRGASGSGDTQGKNKHQDTTRMPRSRFTTNSQGSHKHAGTYGYKADGGGREALVGSTATGFNSNWQGHVENLLHADGSHSHTINGGDSGN